MNRICIAALMTVMICGSGCRVNMELPPSATEKLLSAWDKDIKGSKADYIRILISEGADVNAKNKDGRTPLMDAAKFSNNPEIVTLLLEAGADVNKKGRSDYTPLMFASTPEVATLLIEAGADVNAKDKWGNTLLFYAKTPEIIKLLNAAGAEE